MKAIYTEINGRKTFLGKHANNTIIREFPFRTSVLWQNKNIGFDIRLLKYAKDNSVRSFVFADSTKKESFKIGIKSFDKHYTLGTVNKNQGEQCYISKDWLNRAEYKKTPYIKKEVIL